LVVRLTVVYDNHSLQSNLTSDWGFSCLVEKEEIRLLFDTGANGDILLHNMGKLGIDPRKIGSVMLSHNHWDHVGGLESLLSVNPEINTYRVGFSSRPKEFLLGFMTTGTLGGWGIKEQSLIVTTSRGLVAVTGCSHPGLENILEVASRYGRVYAVVGGFHGFNKFEALREVSLILPCHCTQYKQRIMELYPNTTQKCGAGKTVEL